MAKCPKCGAIWLWDWCGDGYVRPSGEPYKTIEMAFQEGDQWQTELVKCDCGEINAVMIICDCGGGPANTKEWENVDWEDDEHSFDSYSQRKE